MICANGYDILETVKRSVLRRGREGCVGVRMMWRKLKLLSGSYSFKIVISYWLIGFLPFLLISNIIFHYFTVYVQTSSIETLQETHARVDEIISDNIESVSNVLDSAQNYNMFGRIDTLLSEMTAPDSMNRLSVVMNIFLQSSMSVENVIAVNRDEEWMHVSRYKKYRSGYYDFEGKGLINPDMDERVYMIPRHHSQAYFSNANSYVVSMIKNFTDSDGAYVGSIMIDINLSYFQDMLQSNPKAGYFALTDSEHYCILSNDIWNVDNEIQTEGIAAYPVDFDFNNNLPKSSSFFIESDINGVWRAYTYIEKDVLTSNINEIRRAFVTLVVVITLMLLLISLWYTHRLTAPVSRIVSQLKIVQSGNLDICLADERVTEFSQIISGINEMIQKLKIHIDQTYCARMKQKEAELNVLKMQINPHVLYNMLEIINMTAIEQDDYKVSDMITSLGAQFKYMLSNDRDFVTLREEIEILNYYFLFIKMRYDNKIRLNVRAKDSLMDFTVMKFILQPLVENSVKHGYDNSAAPPQTMDINVNIMLYGEEYLLVDVFDNGKGMEKEQLETLRQRVCSAQDSDAKDSIGLKNVCSRLHFFYGEAFAAEINSLPGLGTEVLLKIPLGTVREEAEDEQN